MGWRRYRGTPPPPPSKDPAKFEEIIMYVALPRSCIAQEAVFERPTETSFLFLFKDGAGIGGKL